MVIFDPKVSYLKTINQKEMKMEIKPAIAELSASIQKSITIDAKAATVSVSPTVYVENMPEGVTLESVSAVREYDTNFVTATAHALGTMGVSTMAKHPSLTRLEAEFDMGHKGNSVTHSIDRKKVTIDQLHNKGAEITKFGTMSTTVEFAAGKNSGQLKAARKTISDAAMAAFGNK